MRQETATPDRDVARIAARQHGVVTIEQLRAAGVSSGAVKRRVRAGRLHRVHRGVYAVGHVAIGSKGRWLAAVLACGEGAVLSHVSAAALWELLPPVIAPVHVTILTDSGRRRPGIRLHRSPYMPLEATIHHYAIAVTTPARTIADLRGTLPAERVRQAIREAEAKGLDLGPDHRSDRTNSELEYLFLRPLSPPPLARARGQRPR